MKGVLKDNYEDYENLSTDNKFHILEDLIRCVNEYLDSPKINFNTSQKIQEVATTVATTNKKQAKQKYINKKINRR